MKATQYDAARILAHLTRSTLGTRLRDVRHATRAAIAMLIREGSYFKVENRG